jgi:predicted permease
MGAGRARLIRQWLTESILLGVLGAVGGLLVAYWGTPLLDGLGVLEKIDVSVNPHVLAFTLGCGVATGMMFGLAPTVQLASGNTLPALRDESGAVTTGSRTTRLRSIFIVVQVGLSLILLVGAALFIGAFRHALAIDLGYRVDRMLLADIAPGDKYSAPASVTFYRDVLERVNALPGVVAAGAARVTVLSGASRTVLVSVDGQPLQKDQANAIPVRANVISDRYLEAMGISVLQGRGIQASDVPGTAPVALVTQSLAKRLWPDKNAIGETLVSDSSMQVVGVVPDTVYRSGTDRDPRPFYYVPLAQHPEAGVTLHIRTTGDPMAVLPAVRRVVQDLDPTIALLRPRRLLDEFDRSTMPQRTMAMLIGTLSAIALLLAAVGLYGVMAYATRQRTTEIGLRLALGATPGSVLNLIVMRGVRLVAFGLLIGVVGAVASVRFVRGQLFGVEPTDPTTWFVVVAVLLLITLVACAVPAARAMRTEPSTALRTL